MSTAAIIAKAAAAVLSDERGRKTVGLVLVAVFSPLILIIAVLCSLGDGGAQHNNAAVEAVFTDVAFSDEVPEEYREHVQKMREAFSLLASAVTAANAQAEETVVDLSRVQAVFYVLCFGEDAPTERAANNFAECFYTTETRTRTVVVTNEETGETTTTEETYTVTVPLSLEASYANVAALLGRGITDEDRSNIDHVYTMIAGSAESGGDGGGERGTDPSIDLDASILSDPGTKNAADLAAYAEYAWRSGWGYVWGSFGYVLTEQQLQQLKAQYPEMVGGYESIIRSKWLGGRTADCVGLIKSYGWFDPDELKIKYGTNGMPDVGANQMYYSATVKGTIDTIPEVPGLAVWCNGHIGVYVGGGYVVEARGTSSGVVKTKLAERHFTHWLQVPYIHYS
ncbi:MAG: hypothetical protein J5449_04180 [Oscillospiraceae bacterium]|nr:hypothetical protein [Oscillospiraceae bacterium]